MADTDPVMPDEHLYRRISLNANPPGLSDDRVVLQQAFLPRKNDVDGISLVRAKYRSANEAALPPNSTHREYVVAVVKAADLESLGLTLDVTPDDIDIELGTHAHVSVREMNAANYKSPEVKDWARQIAEHHVLEVLGPFEQ